jgi:MFS family permease
MAPETRTFAELESVLARSLVARVLVAAAASIQRATRNSVVASTITKVRRELGSSPHADRVRVIGASIASFGVTAAILIAMIPVASAPAIPWGVWLGVAACGAAVIVTADAFATAWSHRRKRRERRG